jgi:glycosyltransferase involved in cell wall biosynthesis
MTVDVELSRPFGPLPPSTSGYASASVLVRLHGQPLGLTTLPLAAPPEEQRALAWKELGAPINDHLRRDGLAVLDSLPPAGVPCEGLPACGEKRRRALLPHPPSITVLVATRDRTALLGECLDSLVDQDYVGPYEVVVVDSAPSSDLSGDYVRARAAAGWPTLRYVRTERPGLATAHNHGLAVAQGELLAITDDDVIVDREWLSALAQAFREVPAAACVTGLILPLELETYEQELIEQYGGFARGFERRVYSLDHGRPDDPLFPYTAGRFGSGANMAFATEALRDIGGFDAALGVGTPARGGDDLAAFVSVILAGHDLVYEPGAIIRHRHHRNYAALRTMAEGYGVGFGAYLASLVAARPRTLVDVARRGPGAVAYLLRADSPKNRGKSANYPKELTRLERLGMLRGPWGYVKSRRRYR